MLEDVGGGVLTLVAGAAVLVGVLALLYGWSWLYHRISHRGSFLLVFHPTALGAGARVGDPEQSGHRVTHELLAKVSEYIGADPRGSLAPGALESAAPSTSAESLSAESLTSPHGLAAVFLTLVRAQRPAYHVHLTRLDGGVLENGDLISTADDASSGAARMRIAATIVKQPGSKFITSRTVEVSGDGVDPTQLTARAVEAIGAFCLQQVHSQRRVTRLTPRWERWRSDVAYREYRKGLEMRDRALREQAEDYHVHAQWRQATEERERVVVAKRELEEAAHTAQSREAVELLRARLDQLDRLVNEVDPRVRNTRWWSMLVRAAEHFRRASLADLANLLPRQAEAAVLELLGDHEAARLIYKSCHELWPEQIEQLYRLAVYHSRETTDSDHSRPEVGEGEIYMRPVIRQLGRTRLLRRWLGTWLPWRWLPGERRYWVSWLRPSHPQAPLLSRPTKRREFLVALRVARLSLRLMRRAEGEAPAVLSPEDCRKQTIELLDELDRQLGSRSWWGQRRAGWLAHYNAACAYSQAIELAEKYLPSPDARPQWQRNQAEAALRKLNDVLRDPYSQLDLAWLFTDLDLEPLARNVKTLPYDDPLAHYAAFAALSARPDDAPPHLGAIPEEAGASPRARLLLRLARLRPRRPSNHTRRDSTASGC